MKKKASDLLIAAMNLINWRGWVQNNFSTNRGYCALGAIRHASTHGFAIRCQAEDELRMVIGGSPKASIVDWNDGAGQTKEEVLAGMQEAIDRLQARGL